MLAYPSLPNIPFQPRNRQLPGVLEWHDFRRKQDAAWHSYTRFEDSNPNPTLRELQYQLAHEGLLEEPVLWPERPAHSIGSGFKTTSTMPGDFKNGLMGAVVSLKHHGLKASCETSDFDSTRTASALEKIRNALTLLFVPSADATGYREQFVVIENNKVNQPGYQAPLVSFLDPSQFVDEISDEHPNPVVHPYNSLWRYRPPGSTETYNLFLEAYQRRGFYQPNEVLCKLLVEAVNSLPDFPRDGNLRVLDIGAGSAYEAELMQLALKELLNVTVNINPFCPTQFWKYVLHFKERVKNIDFVGQDLEIEAANAAHEMYGIKNWNSEIKSSYADDPYINGYVVGDIQQTNVRRAVRNAFETGQKPNVLYCAGSLGLPDHINMEDFVAAYNMLEKGGLVVTNIHDNVLENKYGENPTGRGFHNFYTLLSYMEQHPEDPVLETLPFELLKLEQWSYRLLLQDVGTFNPQSKEADLGNAERRGVKLKTAQYFVLRKKKNLVAKNFTDPDKFHKEFGLSSVEVFDLSDPVIENDVRLSAKVLNMGLKKYVDRVTAMIWQEPWGSTIRYSLKIGSDGISHRLEPTN